MINQFVSTRNPLLKFAAFIAILSAFLASEGRAETVLSQTYSRSVPSNFIFSFHSLHDDDFVTNPGPPPTEGYSTLTIDLTIVVRDENNNVISSSYLRVEHSGGQITVLSEFADSFMYIDHYQYEDHFGGESEFYATLELIPPSIYENYTVEVLLLKDRTDNDTHSVDYTIL